MPLSVQDCVPGAVVQEFYDVKGKPLPIRRNGVIVGVNYPNEENTYESGNVRSVQVRFEENLKPEEKPLRVLNLVRTSNSFAQAQIKQERANEKAAEAGVISGTFDEGIVADKTGLLPGKKYGPNDPEITGKAKKNPMFQ